MTSEELLKQGGLFKIRINLTDAFDTEDQDDADSISMLTQDNGDAHYIILRELNSAEMLSLQSTDEKEITGTMEKKLASAIVDHSFQTISGAMTATEDVVKIIKMSSSLLLYVLGKWQESSPLAKRMRKASGGRQAS